MTTAAEIARGLGLRRSGFAYVGACPSCGYRGFQVREAEGIALVKCHAGGCDQGSVLGALSHAGLWEAEATSGRHSPNPNRNSDDLVRLVWSRTLPASRSRVETYLRARGYLGAVPTDLRYVPNAKHTETGTWWPAMVAAVRRVGDAQPVALHRTFLDQAGRTKAPVEPNKKTLGPNVGGAIRLAEAGEQIAITEGIETGLSVLAMTGIATWVALSAGGIRALVLPGLPLAERVTICADHDAVGIAAAHEAGERWSLEGRSVRIALPPRPGDDFNDLATRGEP